MMKKGKLSEIKQGINCSLPELQSIDEKSLNQQVCENLQKFDTLPNILSVNNCKKIIIHLLNNYHPNVPTGLSCFLDDSTRFFETCFPEMREAVIREKRWLNFETPNRVSITHEYVIQLGKKPISNNLFYIFSPSHKLSWLKILINDERVPVANRDIVFEQIKIILDNEISSFVKLILSNLAKQKIFISIDEYNFRNLFQEHLFVSQKTNPLMKMLLS
jgi:hypothetical protein